MIEIKPQLTFLSKSTALKRKQNKSEQNLSKNSKQNQILFNLKLF
jgi:hypothetical protein